MWISSAGGEDERLAESTAEHIVMIVRNSWAALIQLSNATCLMRPRLLLRAVYSAKDRHMFPNRSPLLKNTCVRQV